MKLIKLELENFRQFYEKQSIEFANNDKNITIILGENGKGKTSIFRSIIFCLFDKEYIEQDIEGKPSPKKNSEKIHLVNLNKLDENIGKKVSARVKIIFEHMNENYEIERTISELKNNDTILRDSETKVILEIINKDGLSIKRIDDNKKVKDIINEILNEDIKDFFFFDGEKIKQLSSTGNKARAEIKNGIMKLLQIDNIERALTIINKIKKEQKDKMRNISNTKLESERNILDQLNSDYDKLINDVNNKKENLKKNNIELFDCETKLQENKELKSIFKDKAEEERVKIEKNKRLEKTKAEIREVLKESSHLLLLEDYLFKAKEFIDLEEKNNNFSTLITEELIDYILGNNKCICGKELKHNDESKIFLEKIKKTCQKSVVNDFIRDFKRNINNFNKSKENIKQKINNIIQEKIEIQNGIEEIDKNIDKLDYKIKQSSQTQESLKGYENQYDKLKNDSIKYESLLNDLKIRVEQKKEEIKNKELVIEKLVEEDNKLNIELKKSKYIEQLEQQFKNILDKYSSEMRLKLSVETTNIFKKLISEKDKNIINKVSIDDNYEISADSWNNTQIISDISAGQNQILSLSFVTALAKVAAGNMEKIDIPLFMDTPLGNISGENRDNLLTELPLLTSQLILLVTDTEFTKNEFNIIKNMDKWGNFYELIQIKEGVTEINRISEINNYNIKR